MIPISDNVRDPRIPTICLVLIALNVLVFVGELSRPRAELQDTLYHYGVTPRRYADPDWAAERYPSSVMPFVTSLFLHAGWFHIIGNMWFLYLFGRSIELRMGRVVFPVFYLLCGIVASLVHIMSNPLSTVPTVGASGAIAGVMGAYLFFYHKARIVVLLPVFFFPLFFLVPAKFYVGFWFFIQVFNGSAAVAETAQKGGVAWWAHIGGFVIGLALAACYRGVEKLTGGVEDEVPHVVPLRRPPEH